MAKNHQPLQTKPQEAFVHIPVYTKQDLITLGSSNRKPNHWPTIILCIILVITGQTIATILENFYYDQIDHNENRQNDGVWTQSLLLTVGFPLLVPFYIFTAKKHKQQQQSPTTSDRTSTKYVISFSGLIGILWSNQGRFSAKAKLELPFRVFTLIYTTQLFFTLVFAAFINKLKLNRWIITSLILATTTGALTAFSSSFDEAEASYYGRGSWSALLSSVYFSLLLCVIQNVFKRTEAPSFASVYQVLIFSSLVATISSAAGLLIEGEQEDLKREVNGFSKGKSAYVVMAMVGQAVSWQVYWVGLVGLVFSVSSVLANVISAVTWPIVSVLVVVLFGYVNDEFDVYKGVSLITASLSADAYLYSLHKENHNH